MPAATSSTPQPANMAAKENQTSLKVLDELMAKLNISKDQADINAATASLSTFINGEIETKDAPTK